MGLLGLRARVRYGVGNRVVVMVRSKGGIGFICFCLSVLELKLCHSFPLQTDFRYSWIRFFVK